MGYPMSYQRMLDRNRLHGDYGEYETVVAGTIRGDLRRVETDQRDTTHLRAYARIAGITPEQAQAVLDAFFGQPYDYREFEEEMMFAWLDEDPARRDTKIGQLYVKRKKEIYG